ncbi:hypothetical protein QN277_009197 [Acacia crassicarpa]|uniref:Uncharacterized protein n=1 Tax=Acacia crassicarpa TaxID=499986 RepID=A0AAE1M889_9FABA|nr:hypothetical protein QN277_009197 [Acacia crassicarpa]
MHGHYLICADLTLPLGVKITELLNGIFERFDWDKVMEGDYVVGLKQGKQSISLEPSGQFELRGAPLETLHQTLLKLTHLYQEMIKHMQILLQSLMKDKGDHTAAAV